MLNQFSRTQLLYGKAAMDCLAACRVAVFGIGGVGGYVVEALARSGVGALDLIDDDRICLTNLNRQILATRRTVGRYKVDVAEERIHEINPGCKVRTYRTFYLPETQDQFDFREYDYVVDAIDTVTGKLSIIENAKRAGVPVISSMGAGNKVDPAAFEVADIYETSVCPLARVMRRELKKRGVTACRGNQLLEKLLGTEVIFMDTDDYSDIYAEMDRIGAERGRPYYKIPCGGSNALGSLGYVACAREIAQQGMHFDHIVCAEGSGGTMAGMALGAQLYLPGTKVHGMMVDTDPFEEVTPRLMREAAALLETEVDIILNDYCLRDMCGPGYAIPSAEGDASVRLMAEKEGIFLDPVYTGKAFAGLIAMAKEGAFLEGEKILFLHTGGAGGLFAIAEED